MRSAGLLAVLTCGAWLGLIGCGDEPTTSSPPAARTPAPAPAVTLTKEEKQVWAKLAPDRSAIPVLLYHGIGPESDFANADDAGYGVDADDFAKQMTEIDHAGYETVELETFLDFVDGDKVDLPPRPLLLTFDDARADSWTGADDILRKLDFNAVMFVDVGRVDAGEREYLTWDELDAVDDDRWELQLHSGDGHQQIQYGPGDDDYGPYYAYKEQGEDFAGWRERVRSDITWGQDTLAEHTPEYEPLAFAPPYGNYGQDGTNDERIPDDLLGWLTDRYDAVFTQDVNSRARAGADQPLGRAQITRTVSGGDLHAWLLSGEP
jgi:peptidoglycan/xylan/chitin deacetylase (PgdA/CDA1 family)